ncbi:hypothetical protein EYF80_037655 [Liparis tanakae]|uniref:Uncharacterized protein n=1 Tax=Liparis tanakae TaxID=230148 RepID=A0A4Z2GF08_9TELE|nr:hypothetical protein EYF80_037655 [Liparis tanakae]
MYPPVYSFRRRASVWPAARPSAAPVLVEPAVGLVLPVPKHRYQRTHGPVPKDRYQRTGTKGPVTKDLYQRTGTKGPTDWYQRTGTKGPTDRYQRTGTKGPTDRYQRTGTKGPTDRYRALNVYRVPTSAASQAASRTLSRQPGRKHGAPFGAPCLREEDLKETETLRRLEGRVFTSGPGCRRPQLVAHVHHSGGQRVTVLVV